MRNTENKNRLFVIQAAVAVLLICVTVLSFVIFLRDNRVRIIDQNNSFIQAAAVQKAERISDLISASENRLRMIVDLYESVLDEPVIDSQVLKDMVELSQFDYVEFISPDGEDLTANAFSDDIWKAHEAGMNDHISKPVEIEKLMNAMSKWLAEKTV